MSQKMGSVIIGIGIIMILIGAAFLPLAFGEHRDEATVTAGAAIFSFGALLIAAGLYIKARATEVRLRTEFPSASQSQSSRRKKGACDVCHEPGAVISCTQHRATLCATCLVAHYDARACVYVPAQRRVSKAAMAGGRGF
jgi:hypothetical protein